MQDGTICIGYEMHRQFFRSGSVSRQVDIRELVTRLLPGNQALITLQLHAHARHPPNEKTRSQEPVPGLFVGGVPPICGACHQIMEHATDRTTLATQGWPHAMTITSRRSSRKPRRTSGTTRSNPCTRRGARCAPCKRRRTVCTPRCRSWPGPG